MSKEYYLFKLTQGKIFKLYKLWRKLRNKKHNIIHFHGPFDLHLLCLVNEFQILGKSIFNWLVVFCYFVCSYYMLSKETLLL